MQNMLIKPYILLALLALCSFNNSFAADYKNFFDSSLGDLSEELEIAAEQNKKAVLIFFESDDCPFCMRMKTQVLNQQKVQDYYKEHFLILPMDIEGDIDISDFEGNDTQQKEFSTKKMRIRATPVFAFFDLQGKLIARYTGATRTAREFLWLGEYVVDGHFKKQSFNRFKRSKKKALSNS